MHLLHFGTFEGILYPYVKHNLRGENRIQNETDFVFHLLLAADENAEVIRDFAPSAASRYRTGARAIPEDIVALFRRPKARAMVIDYLDDLVVPYVDRGRRQQLVGELSDILEQDTTIDLEFKDALQKEAVPERLAAFLADLLIYAVGIDPTERDKEYPVENYNLPMSNDWFMGRKKELAEIDQNFADGCRMQILCGMGGMGKSQIARRFAYEHFRSYSFIHWINSSTIDSITECYKAFLAEKKIVPADDKAETICKAYTNYLDSHSDWLLIYDNCDYYTDKEYAEFSELCLPKNQAVGNILLTARNKRSIGKAKRIEIGTLPDTDAVEFLLQRTGMDDTTGAERLSARLGRFPLALEIAGAYIHATPGCDFAAYLSYLEQETKILNQMVEVTNYNETIKDILLLALKRIREDRGGDVISLCVEDVLHLFSYGAPYDIDLRTLAFVPFQDEDYDEFISSCVDEENHFGELKQIFADPLQRNELARALVAYGLMTEQPNGLLSMHELQQEVLKNEIFWQNDWARFFYAAVLIDFEQRNDAVWLYVYQHGFYVTKHWMEMSKRLNVSEKVVKNLTAWYQEAVAELEAEKNYAGTRDVRLRGPDSERG